jgi:hypothetical protein
LQSSKPYAVIEDKFSSEELQKLSRKNLQKGSKKEKSRNNHKLDSEFKRTLRE